MGLRYLHDHGGVAAPDCSRGDAGFTTTPQIRLNGVHSLLVEIKFITPQWALCCQPPKLHTCSQKMGYHVVLGPAWRSGKAVARLVSRQTSVPFRFGCGFSLKVAVCGHCMIVTLFLHNDGDIETAHVTAHLNEECFWF